MPSLILQRIAAAGSATLLAGVLAAPAFAAGPVTVTLNGTTLNLNPAPTERAGRVFVPLRGVFENLGASVVYANGVINATGRGHTVSLRIGSQQATVDGQPQTVDVAPFIIGASTYVPLRFVSQALGANVNYDGTNNVVAISAGGAHVSQAPPNEVITPAPNRNGEFGSINLTNVLPARDAQVSSRRPTIEAYFSGGTVDPSSVRISLDGNDVTDDATRSPRGFTYAPRSPLQPGRHRVRVTGTDRNGGNFAREWTFTSGNSEVSVGQITGVRPPDGVAVPNSFVVSGRTSPGARVSIQVGGAGGGNTVGGLLGAILGANGGNNNTFVYNTTADGNGRFSAQVNIGAPSGSTLYLVVTATDPQSGASAQPVRERLTVQ
ncbi:MAG TPA: copper amine oxidase N-terminal domain-containing protein [Candidatus Elarobacter sp.]|jgi:hypothetical protein|nr:copper amine oxidase N-terminal domain-containing protein [Candidatus Elarobacter sp.]